MGSDFSGFCGFDLWCSSGCVCLSLALIATVDLVGKLKTVMFLTFDVHVSLGEHQFKSKHLFLCLVCKHWFFNVVGVFCCAENTLGKNLLHLDKSESNLSTLPLPRYPHPLATTLIKRIESRQTRNEMSCLDLSNEARPFPQFTCWRLTGIESVRGFIPRFQPAVTDSSILRREKTSWQSRALPAELAESPSEIYCRLRPLKTRGKKWNNKTGQHWKIMFWKMRVQQKSILIEFCKQGIVLNVMPFSGSRLEGLNISWHSKDPRTWSQSLLSALREETAKRWFHDVWSLKWEAIRCWNKSMPLWTGKKFPHIGDTEHLHPGLNPPIPQERGQMSIVKTGVKKTIGTLQTEPSQTKSYQHPRTSGRAHRPCEKLMLQYQPGLEGRGADNVSVVQCVPWKSAFRKKACLWGKTSP